MIHGHVDIVFTLLSLFLMTVIFMTQLLLGAPRAGWHYGLGTTDSRRQTRLAQVVDDDVHEPGSKRAVLLRILRLFAVHW